MNPDDINNPVLAQYQYLTEQARKRREEVEQFTAPIRAAEQERTDYYQALRSQYNNFPTLTDHDYDFLDAAQTIISNPGFDGDFELERDRIFAAAVYANALNQPMDVAYQNLDIFHEQWTGKKFVKKTGVQAVIDSFALSFEAELQNRLAIEYHNSGQDPEVLKQLQEVNQKIARLRDNVPKIWQDEYIKQGGVADVLAFFRSITTSAAENAVPIGMAIGAGALAATGVGAIAEAAALPAGLSGMLVSGASGLAMAESTALSTVGTEYFDLISQGIPDDIAWTNANISAQIQGVIEAVGGGVASTTTKRILKSVAPAAMEKAAARWFIKGKMGAGAKAFLDWLQETAGEGFEEGTQQITSIAFYNRAAEQTNRRRDELLQRIYAEPLEEARKELEKELENYPEIDKKEFEEAWGEITEATIGGLGTALLLGIPGATIGYVNNVQSAGTLARMAREAPNEAMFREAVEKAKSEGFEIPATQELKTDEEAALLSEIYKVQQERMTPEQREAKQRAAQDAAALSEVTDYRNVETVQTEDKETGGTITELAAPDTSDIYREGGRLEINEYTDTNEDGSTNGRFVAGDPRIEDTERSGANQYGYINYTETDNTVTINEFRMLSGYENLRTDLYRQFAERFTGRNIQWTPQNEQNNGIKEQLVNANPRGPKEGLNYYEQGSQPQVSKEARQVAERFRRYLKNSTPLETALAVETFGAFYRRRGESLDGAMGRLLGKITNEAPQSVTAAQTKGQAVKGAIWFEKTAEGMRGIVYVNKNAADSSTVVHEISHAVAMDFTEAERNIAAQALNGYKLKNGATVNFEDNNGQWTDEQHEAFAEALENYLTNGTAPNEEIKGLFERIKEFMKRIYQTMKGWTELSPEAERFYKSLLSGELADEAQAKNSPQAHEEGYSGTQEIKRENDTANNPATPLEAAITRQRDAVIADPDISLENKAQAVFDAAGDALFQTIGEQGAAALDRAEETTVRLDNLVIARQMEAAGKDAGAVRLATGWERGADGKWRYEILDAHGMNRYTKMPAMLKSLLTAAVNKELFSAYPQLKDTLVRYDKTLSPNTSGEYNSKTNEIGLNPASDYKTLYSVLIHEIQHAIQYIEGFARGGNSGQFIQQNSKQSVLDDIEKARLKAFNEIPENLKEAARKINRNEDADGLALAQIQADPAAKAAWADYIRALANAAEIAEIPYEQFDGLSPDEQYRRLAGEVESRNAEARMGFTPQQRLETLLEETEDVAREDQVFLAEGTQTGAAMAMTDENRGKRDIQEYKAPNGKPSNLNHTQWYAVRTENFKKWFGDWENDPENASKIVDENGEPTPVFHGTVTKFDAFSLEKAGTRRDPGKLGKGFYFSTDKKAASLGDSITMTLFASAKNPLYLKMVKWGQDKTETVSKALGLKEPKDSTEIREKIIQSGYDGVILDYSPLEYNHKEIMLLNPEQVKSATDNAGTYDGANPSILFQIDEHTDADYFKAIESGDMETAQRIVDYRARQKGYISADEYRMNHRAPDSHSEDGFFQNLKNVRESKLVPDDYWTTPKHYLNSPVDYQSFYAITKAMNSDRVSIRMYRAVPKNVKEDVFRNGDWITPSRGYAEREGSEIPGGYRIIQEVVNIKDVWWDANSINEFGYDDGKDYAYKNTKNNRKLNDVIVRDYDGHIVPPSKRFNYRAYEIFYQTDRDMMEEAAGFDDGKEYRGYIETFFELPQEVEGFTDEQIDVWFDEFVKKAKQAVNSSEQSSETAAGEKLTPAETDRQFNKLIGEKGKLDEFVKMLTDTHNQDYSTWQAVDEEDESERGRQMEMTNTLRRRLTHPTWQSIFKANGEIGPTQRKQLLTLIRKAPRDYRAIYADVMERPEFSVSAEDTTAAALKYRLADSRREDIDSLTPEKLRQLAEQLDIEAYAEKVKTGRALFNDPAEKAYIKQLQDQRKEVEQTLKEAEAHQTEDNEYLERMAGKQFMDTFNRAVKAREAITRSNERLDRAIATGKKNAGLFAWRAQRATANYNGIVQTLESLAQAQKLELDVREALEDQRIHDAVQAAKKELKTEAREKIDALKDEFKKTRERERTKASLQKKFAVLMAVNDLKAYQADLKERQETAKELTQAKRGVTKRILRPINPREVNADQGRAVAIIQRLVEPSMLEGIDRFIGGIEKPYLRTIFETWKIDESLRTGIMKDKTNATQEKLTRLFNKGNFDDLTNAEKKYLYRVIPPNDWATALGLENIINRRNENYPTMNGEAEQQIAFKYLPPDVYYRIMDKPFSEWTLEEGEDLAKIIDDLTVQGKEIYKANIDAEKRRISEYQRAVVKTIGNVTKRGLQDNPDDTLEERARKDAGRGKILNEYNEGTGGTAQAQAKRRKNNGPLLGYADMNIYRFARMLDNGDTNGKNSAALYRRASDAYNQKMVSIDTRTERIQKIMKEMKITQSELWKNTLEIDLGGEMGRTNFTAAELIGFISASRDSYSREAVMYGNLLLEQERGHYQYEGATHVDLIPLYELAEGRFNKVMNAAEKLVADRPEYQRLMDAIDEDFTEGGKRLSEALIRYNNTYMPIVDKYFPINRQAPVSIKSADAQYARDLMGASAGGFNLFVEKGFTNKRQEIPAQYQTAIKLDILGVWSEAVSKEEHFMAYGQLVKDLNAIYKQNRQVKDTIQRRYGRQAVDYINKYTNELANPNPEKVRTSLDNTIKLMRGNTAAAYLGWKVSGIAKQFITSPAPFFAYMNPVEYWGTFIEFITHKEDTWREIVGMSEHMEHRSANLLTELVKEQAKQKFDNKVDATISSINKKGMEGLEWIDRMCVAPGWLVLYRKEFRRLTNGNEGGTLTERDAKVKAAQYADDITRLTQPSGRPEDLSPLFKGNTELGKAVLQFTASLNVIWQNIRYDLPQMIRDRRYKNAAGTIIGYALAGILLGAITVGFDDDDDETAKAEKLAWWATTQFTDAFPIIGSEATHLAELLLTGKAQYQSGLNLVPAFQKMWNAAGSGIKGVREDDFNKLLKAAAAAAEGAALFKGLPVSGIKEAGLIFGIGDGDEEAGINPGAVFGRR